MDDVFLDDLIGVPFVPGARGPDAYDCYGLVRELYFRAHGVHIPDFTRPKGLPTQEVAEIMDDQRQLHLSWHEAPRAAGSIVLLRVNGAASHVGFMLDAGTMCHTWKDSGGVTVERLTDWEHRIVGFYRHAHAA